MKSTNILIVGIGGQGVMTAADVLARAALATGYDACKTENAGMSQRGGIVSSQVRIGQRIHASEIMPGEVNLLLALEAAEALRWCHWLAPGGRAIVNTLRAVPPIVSSGRAQYPDDPLDQLRALGHDVRALDAGAIAAELGDARLANAALLGAAADAVPMGSGALLDELLRRFERHEDKRRRNAQAFEAGRSLAASQAAAAKGHLPQAA